MSRSFQSTLAFASLAMVLQLGSAQAQAPGANQAQSASSAQINAQTLHDSLHLTLPQEDAWRAYRRASAPDPEAASRHRSAMMMMPSLTTPRRIDLIAAEMQADLDAAKHKGDAVKAFYATLTSEQQHTFDRQTLQTSARPTDKLRQPSNQTLPKPTQ